MVMESVPYRRVYVRSTYYLQARNSSGSSEWVLPPIVTTPAP